MKKTVKFCFKSEKNSEFFNVFIRTFVVTLSGVALIIIGYFTAAAFFGG